MTEEEKKDEYEKYASQLDSEKCCGRYLHFGHFIQDFENDKNTALSQFHFELYKFYATLLCSYADFEAFDKLKKFLVEAIDYVKNRINKLESKQLQGIADDILKFARKNFDEIKKRWGKKNHEYFT